MPHVTGRETDNYGVPKDFQLRLAGRDSSPGRGPGHYRGFCFMPYAESNESTRFLGSDSVISHQLSPGGGVEKPSHLVPTAAEGVAYQADVWG